MAKKLTSYPTAADVEAVFKLSASDRTSVMVSTDPRTVIHNFAHLNKQFNLRGVVVYGFNWGKHMTHFNIKEMNRLYAKMNCVCVPVLSKHLGFKAPLFYLIHAVCKENNK
jgi:hypothetical protein